MSALEETKIRISGRSRERERERERKERFFIQKENEKFGIRIIL